MSTAVQLREQAQTVRFNTVRKLLESPAVQKQVALALPKYMTPERMLRVAVTALKNNPRLLECTEGSLVNAVTQAAELGLEVNSPLGYAYLVPYGDQCTLQVGYRGFINLAHRSGKISSMAAEVVYEKDQFAIQLGTNRNLLHVPFLGGDRGRMLGAYATVLFKDGTSDFEYMDATEIGTIRSRSAGAKKKGNPWETDETEMWRKTPIRRLAKRLPMTADDQSLLRAAIIDEYNDAGIPVPGQLPESVGDSAEKITEEQRAALVNAAKESQADLPAIVAEFGFNVIANITTDRYDEILARVSPEPAAIEGEPVFDETEVKVQELREAIEEAIKDRPVGNYVDTYRERLAMLTDVKALSELLEEVLAL